MNPAEPRRGVRASHRRHRRARGAISLLALVVLQLAAVGAAGAEVHIGAVNAAVHAQSGADSVAHAAAAALVGDAHATDAEIAMQAGASCALDTGVGGHGDIVAAATPACVAALAGATGVARADHVHIVALRAGADPRAYVAGAPPSLFEVVVEVEYPGPLAGFSELCADHLSRHGLCWADAWSAARNAG